MMRSVRRASLACVLASLAGCGWFGGGEDTHKAANAITGTEDTTQTVTLGNGDGLNLPTTVAGFTRDDVRVGNKATEASGSYTHGGPPGAIVATVHVQQASGGSSLIPFTGGGGGNTATKSRSDAALSALVAQITREHPDAALIGRSDVFLVRFGVVQAGRAAELTATDEIGGQRQPVRVLAETFCCVNGKWEYQYRFEAPAGVRAREIENAFARAIAWSREPGASVDQAE